MLENRPVLAGVIAAASLIAVSLLLYAVLGSGDGSPGTTLADGSATSVPGQSTTSTTFAGSTTAESSTTSTTSLEPALHEWVDRSTVGQPWGNVVDGLLTFRGNPTNTWYGTGPVPESPGILWQYPDAPMCSRSTDLGVTSTWCGNGWNVPMG